MMYTSSIIGGRENNNAPLNNNNNINNNNLLSEGPHSDDPATLIHTSFAKVYTMNISPTPKTWIPATPIPVPVSFYFDKQRSVYRILSYEGERLIINSTIVPSMTFNKPSSAFGLWSDTKLRVIFGLGFPSQGARDLAADWFEKVVTAAANLEQTKKLQNKNNNNNNSAFPPPTSEAPFSATTTNWLTDDEFGTSSTSLLHLHDSLTRSPPLKPVVALDPAEEEEYGPHTDRVVIAVGSAVMEQSFKNLQQEEERESKLAGLEKELSQLHLAFSTTQENLSKKMREGETLVQKVNESREQLQVQINRAERAEKLVQEEKARVTVLEGEIEQLKGIITQQTGSIAEIVEQKRKLEQETKVLTQSLARFNLEEIDKDLLNFEMISNDICQKMQDLLKIRERLRNNLHLTKSLPNM